MAEIVEIILTSKSGYCGPEDAYSDRLIINQSSISYEYIPLMQETYSWNYKSHSENFSIAYKDICDKISNLLETQLNKTEVFQVIDGEVIKINIDYDDGTEKGYTFTYFDRIFIDSISSITQLVPPVEELPKVLNVESEGDEE